MPDLNNEFEKYRNSLKSVCKNIYNLEFDELSSEEKLIFLNNIHFINFSKHDSCNEVINKSSGDYDYSALMPFLSMYPCFM